MLIAPALATSEIIIGALLVLGGGIGSTALSANPLTYSLVTRCHCGGRCRHKRIIIFLFINRSSIFVEQVVLTRKLLYANYIRESGVSEIGVFLAGLEA